MIDLSFLIVLDRTKLVLGLYDLNTSRVSFDPVVTVVLDTCTTRTVVLHPNMDFLTDDGAKHKAVVPP